MDAALSSHLIVAHGLIGLGAALGIVGHVLKKVIQQRESDATFSLNKYLTMYPYKTAMTVFYAVGGLAGLYFSGTESFYTALLTGFAANSLSGASDK